MARGALSAKQVDIVAKALYDGKIQTEACRMAGLSIENATRTCNGKRVQQRLMELEAEHERMQQERDSLTGAKEPMTIKEYQAFLERRMLDDSNKDSARYAEMYGKTIRAFVDKVEVEQSVSYAEILAKRKKKN